MGVERTSSAEAAPLRNSTEAVLKRLNDELAEKAEELLTANNALVEREQRLRLAIETGRIGLWVWNSTDLTNSGDWSQRLKEIFGLPLDAAVTHDMFLKCVHPEDRERVNAAVMGALGGVNGGRYAIEYRTNHPQNGSDHWVVARGQAFFDDQGRAVRFIGTVMDVTELKWAEQTLTREKQELEQLVEQRSEEIAREREQFALAIDTIPALVWTARANGDIDFLNRRWREYTGISLAEGRGWGWKSSIHPEDVVGLEHYWRSLLASKEAGETEARLRRFDGSFRWFLIRAVPLMDKTGQVAKWYGTNTDIDDRKRAEEKLRRNQRFLTEAQRLSLVGSFSLRLPEGILEWSEQTARIAGYPPDTEPSLDRAFLRVHPDDMPMVQAAHEAALRGRTGMDIQHRLLLPDNSIRYVHVVASVASTEGDAVELIGAVVDITERSRAAEALRASEHLARGQLDALVDTLAGLSREPKPQKFLEHVCHIICCQLGAMGLGAWERFTEAGGAQLIINYEDSRLNFPTPEEMQVLPSKPFPTEEHPVWTEFFKNPEACVFGQITLDPLRVLFALDPNGPWYDRVDGSPMASPIVWKACQRVGAAGVAATLCVPLVVGGSVKGLYSIRFKQRRNFRPEELNLTRAMAHLATLAIQLYRLSEQGREAAVMSERNRLAREIHDTLAQGFTGVIMQMEAAKGALARQDWSRVSEHIGYAGEQARASLGEARHSVASLRPHPMREGRLRIVLDDLIRRLGEGSQLQVTFLVEGDERPLPIDWEENLLRIAGETLNNTLKHANARTFRAVLKYQPTQIELHLSDDGCGFDIAEVHQGFGLIGMRERVHGLQGRFALQSAIGQGTEILVTLDGPECFRAGAPLNNGAQQ